LIVLIPHTSPPSTQITVDKQKIAEKENLFMLGTGPARRVKQSGTCLLSPDSLPRTLLPEPLGLQPDMLKGLSGYKSERKGKRGREKAN